MAVGGWKFARITFNYPEDYEERSKYVLKSAVEALIGLGVGWALDDSRNATVDDFTNIGTGTGAAYNPALFLKHAEGAKLLMCVILYNGRFNTNLYPKYGSYSTLYQYDLCVSLIPKQHSDKDWESSNNYTTVSAIPEVASRLLGTEWNSNYYTTGSPMYNKRARDLVIIAKGDAITFLMIDTTTSNRPRKGFSIGSDLIPTLANVGDTDTFGAIHYQIALNDNSLPFPDLMDWDSECMYCGFNGTDSTRMSYCGASDTVCSCAPFANLRTTSTQTTDYSKSGRVRFIPIEAYLYSTNLLEYNVVTGDGFKGYFSTDFIRYIGYNQGLPVGQLLDGGNFIHLGAGIIHGWDASITGSIL